MCSADARRQPITDAKAETLRRIRQTGVMPVIRAGSEEEALALAEAIVAGGIDVLEVTMTVPRAVEVMRLLIQRHPDALIGAGTVLNRDAALRCIDAGARFVVSPALDAQTVSACLEHGTVAIPGALTPTEVVTAWQAGADLVKVFPAAAVGGPTYLRSLKGPLPEIPLLPSGGVTLASAADYLAAGAYALGAGGDLADCKAIREGRAEAVTATARAYRDVVAHFLATQSPLLKS